MIFEVWVGEFVYLVEVVVVVVVVVDGVVWVGFEVYIDGWYVDVVLESSEVVVVFYGVNFVILDVVYSLVFYGLVWWLDLMNCFFEEVV